jgi:hypothetical protein
MLVSSSLSKDVRPRKSLPMNSSAPEMTPGVVAEEQPADRRDRRAQQHLAADDARRQPGSRRWLAGPGRDSPRPLKQHGRVFTAGSQFRYG